LGIEIAGFRGIRVTELTTIEEIATIRQPWSELWDRCALAPPFLSQEWMLPWWRHLYGGGEIWVLTAWEDNCLRGVAPLFIHGIGKRKVSLAGSGVTDYLDVLVDDAFRREATQALCDYVCRWRSRWSECTFVDIPAGSSLLEVSFGNCAVERRSGPVCPYVKLPAEFATFEKQLSARFRHHLRNSWNRALDAGVGFETNADGNGGEYLEALFRLHAARWQPRGLTGMLGGADMRHFLREVMAGFRARDWIRWFGLRLGETLRAVACIFRTRQRWLYYLSGFDQTLARYGPGNLLLRLAIQEAIREQGDEFDFLRNPEAYKYRWGALNRSNTELFIHSESCSPATR
jgi:CelD/BcsL family acetyltransferase involved in cellulose biosynthesis